MNKDFWEINKSKISLLISNKENEIWEIIHNTNNSLPYSFHVINYVEQLIMCYIYVSKMLGEQLPYKNLKEFFCYCNLEGVNEYEKFSKNRTYKFQNIPYEEKLIFLLRHTEGEICKSIFNVLNDNEDDPHFSAVYSSNMIKCFIDISSAIGCSLLYNDICGFFIAHGFCLSQYYEFENKRNFESDSYRGVQY